MFEGDDLLRRDNVVTNVEALDVALLEGICELLNVIHDDKIVADVKVLQGRVALADDFAELLRRLTRNLCRRYVTNLDTIGLDETLSDFQASLIANLFIVTEANFFYACTHCE